MFISKELLQECCNELSLSINDDIISKFDTYATELVKYNDKVNLTAITDPDEIVIKHFADSLALFKYVDTLPSSKLADVGTGAGFPGIPSLIYGNVNLTVFDAVNKKLDFIRYLLNQLGLSAEVIHKRAEDAGKDPAFREKFDFVTARAVAQLRVLSEFCVPLVKVGGSFLSMKGDISVEERQFISPACEKLGAKVINEYNYTTHSGDIRNLIIIKKLSQTSSKYPRNMGQINKKPL